MERPKRLNGDSWNWIQYADHLEAQNKELMSDVIKLTTIISYLRERNKRLQEDFDHSEKCRFELLNK